MTKIKIVNYKPIEEGTFEEQLNKVLETLEEDNNDFINQIKDIKVINEKKVIIIYNKSN